MTANLWPTMFGYTLGVSQKRRRRGRGGVKKIANFVRRRFWLAPYSFNMQKEFF